MIFIHNRHGPSFFDPKHSRHTFLLNFASFNIDLAWFWLLLCVKRNGANTKLDFSLESNHISSHSTYQYFHSISYFSSNSFLTILEHWYLDWTMSQKWKRKPKKKRSQWTLNIQWMMSGKLLFYLMMNFMHLLCTNFTPKLNVDKKSLQIFSWPSQSIARFLDLARSREI